MKTLFQPIAFVFFLLLLAVSATAADQQEFERIQYLGMDELTEEAHALLEKRYPDEKWDSYRFPRYVFTNDSVEAGYMIAVKEGGLLKQFRCYCFCDAMGHKNLFDCFIKSEGRRIKFDEHGAGCNICYGQAMMALLWQEAGFTQEQMQAGFEKRFERLIEQFGNQ